MMGNLTGGCFGMDFLLGCNQNPPVNCQRYMISTWGWSGQSFPPLLAPEVASISSNNGILTVAYSNQRTTSPMGSRSGKIGNGLTTVITTGCTSERALYYIMHGYLGVSVLVGSLYSPRQRKATQVVPPPLCPQTWVSKSWKFPCLQKKSQQNLSPTITHGIALITQFCHQAMGHQVLVQSYTVD